MHAIEIIYQDPALVVINKPAGLLTVPGLATPDNAFDRVKQQFPNSRVVHRLDMATSGLVIFPQTHRCLQAMGRLFEQRQIYKRYTAVVSGLLEASCGEIAIPLVCDWQNRPKQKADFIAGKAALTRFQVISRDTSRQCSRLTLEPLTGRSHQLRVHLQQIGHAIIGDHFYAATNTPHACERLLLHATLLRFQHPIDGRTLELHCAPTF